MVEQKLEDICTWKLYKTNIPKCLNECDGYDKSCPQYSKPKKPNKKSEDIGRLESFENGGGLTENLGKLWDKLR